MTEFLHIVKISAKKFIYSYKVCIGMFLHVFLYEYASKKIFFEQISKKKRLSIQQTNNTDAYKIFTQH